MWEQTACEGETLHVALLCTAEAEDSFLREEVERERVDAFLVDDSEGLSVCAHLTLELNDLADGLVDGFALSSGHDLTLLGGGIGVGRVDFTGEDEGGVGHYR